MKKYILTITLIFLLTGKILYAQLSAITIPISSANFPGCIIDADSGKIEFYGLLQGFSGSLPTGNGAYFFDARDGRYALGSTCHPRTPNAAVNEYTMGFNNNNGLSAGGLTIAAGAGVCGGTGVFGYWTYDMIYGSTAAVSKWHCYTYEWNKSGLPDLDRKYQVAILIDGKLNTGYWQNANCYSRLVKLDTGTFNLITTPNATALSQELAIDELKVYNGKGKLILYNTLDSKAAIENSEVGPNGSFNGYGSAHFIKGVKGYALSAHPVYNVQVISPQTTTANTNAKTFTINISPNPVAGSTLNMIVTSSKPANFQLTISNMQGKIFVTEVLHVNAAYFTKAIDVSILPKGIYVITLTKNDNEQQQIKFIKNN